MRHDRPSGLPRFCSRVGGEGSTRANNMCLRISAYADYRICVYMYVYSMYTCIHMHIYTYTYIDINIHVDML